MNALPEYILFELCKYLEPSDLISLEKVGTDLNKKIKTKYIWKYQFMKQGGCCNSSPTHWFVYKKATFMCKIMNVFASRKRLLTWIMTSNQCQIKLIAI